MDSNLIVMLVFALISGTITALVVKLFLRAPFFRSLFAGFALTLSVQVAGIISGQLNGKSQIGFALIGLLVSLCIEIVVYKSVKKKRTDGKTAASQVIGDDGEPLEATPKAPETSQTREQPRTRQAFRMVPTDKPPPSATGGR